MSKANLTKTCNSCGMQKPLSAFLQVAGPEGTTYGNICATCRKENKDKSVIARDIEEGTTTSTEHKIDIKTKVQAEVDKREERQRLEEEYYEDREKEQEKESSHVQKTQKKAKEEKTRIESFLEKRPYTDPNKSQKPPAGSAADVADREKNTDFKAPFMDTQIAGKIKYEQSSIFQQFKKWLGDTPMTRQGQVPASVKDKIKKAPLPGKNAPGDAGAAPKKTSVAGQSLIGAPAKEPQAGDTASKEYIEKTWGPNSRRR